MDDLTAPGLTTTHAMRPWRVLALALVVFAASLAAFPGAALAGMTLAKLRLGSTTGPEDYLYTAGNAVSASGTLDAGSFYRFVVTDPSAVVRSTTPCKPTPA